ncbi:MAG TPA: leucine-rich repeat domain-containing protein [Verrucomicrobiales bacterium]|nr:leucine-rich repeat domain-containing protein [Verrucomicrobiales bacterium]
MFTYEVVNGATVTITDYPENATGPVAIPSEIAGKPVTGIRNGAFSVCAGMTSVTIPSSITSIGGYAFYGCRGLTSITIPSSVTSFGEGALQECTGLTSVTLEHGLTRIGRSMFAICSGLTSINIPSSVATIDDYAFSSCTGLTSITIPSSVTSLGSGAFYGCFGLAAINVEPANPAYSSDSGVLLNAARTTLVSCPQGRAGAYSIPSGVSTIDPFAFVGCTLLTSLTLPSSLTIIGDSAFRSCTGLTAINVAPGNPAFSSDAGVLLNAARTTILFCPQAKAGPCTIPSSITSIGAQAFVGCTALTSVTIPASVTSIGDLAFYSCTGLTAIDVEPGNPAYSSDRGVLLNAARTMLIVCPAGKAGTCAIPASVTGIGDAAFFFCARLTSVIIPAGVTSIGAEYFDDEGDSYDTDVFYNCSSLTRLVLLGDAPALPGGDFSGSAQGFTIYFLSSSNGFTSPAWHGYSATMIDESTYPAAAWLLAHGLWYNTSLHTDPDGDGVSLRMAWALDLDPTLPQESQMPAPVLTGNTLSLTFSATRPGLTYLVETSTALTNWTTTGITLSPPGPDGRTTATVPLNAPRRFLRITVED